MRDSLLCFGALLATSLRSACARRIAFLLSAGMMIVNNLLFFVTWWLIYERVPTIGGWAYEDMQLLFGISALSYGLIAVLFDGVRKLAYEIGEGSLDSFILKPRHVLMQLACSKCSASGFGDIVTGVFFLAVSVHSVAEWMFMPIFIVTATVILFSTSVLVHSIAFWLRGMEETSEMAISCMLLFPSYPGSIYTDWFRVVLFTILPAGFMSLLPVEAIRSLDVLQAGAIVAAAVGYMWLAFFVFSRGLRRYESGSRIEVGARR